MAIHPRRGRLHHHHGAEAINHEAGKAVAFSVHQAIAAGLAIAGFSKGEGGPKALKDQGLIKALLGIAAEQAGANQRLGADQHSPQGPALGVFQHRLVPRRKGLQGRFRRINLVGIDPHVPPAKTSLFPRF